MLGHETIHRTRNSVTTTALVGREQGRALTAQPSAQTTPSENLALLSARVEVLEELLSLVPRAARRTSGPRLLLQTVGPVETLTELARDTRRRLAPDGHSQCVSAGVQPPLRGQAHPVLLEPLVSHDGAYSSSLFG
jgi:hypothetical protein